MELTTFIKFAAERFHQQKILVVCPSLSHLKEMTRRIAIEFYVNFMKRTQYYFRLDNGTEIYLHTQSDVQNGGILGMRFNLIILAEGVELQNQPFLRCVTDKSLFATVYIEDEDRFIF